MKNSLIRTSQKRRIKIRLNRIIFLFYEIYHSTNNDTEMLNNIEVMLINTEIECLNLVELIRRKKE
jgi:hypothetical protein